MQLQKIELNQSFAWSLGSLALIATILVFTLPSVFAAAMSSNPEELQASTQLDSHLGKHREALDLYQDRFNGRSVFFTPNKTKAPYVPLPVVEQKAPQTSRTEKVRTPPKPTIYTGPTLMAILGDEVWLKNSNRNDSPLRVRVGEEKDGVEILEVNPPWSVKVRYQTVEFVVPLFEVKEFLSESSETQAETPKGLIETTKSELEEEAEGAAITDSDKNQLETEQDPDSTPKSDTPDADNSDTTSTTTGNAGSKEQ